jgi:hypothetical protein
MCSAGSPCRHCVLRFRTQPPARSNLDVEALQDLIGAGRRVGGGAAVPVPGHRTVHAGQRWIKVRSMKAGTLDVFLSHPCLELASRELADAELFGDAPAMASSSHVVVKVRSQIRLVRVDFWWSGVLPKVGTIVHRGHLDLPNGRLYVRDVDRSELASKPETWRTRPRGTRSPLRLSTA